MKVKNVRKPLKAYKKICQNKKKRENNWKNN